MLNQLHRRRDTARSFIRRPSVSFEDETSIHVPGTGPPPLRRPTMLLHRGHSLSRPERGHPRAPLLNPEGEPDDPFSDGRKPHWWRMWWHYLAIVATFWAPPPLLNLVGLHSAPVRQAWREKVTLVLFACALSAIIAFITVGLQRSLCSNQTDNLFMNVKDASGAVGVLGNAYSLSDRPNLGGTELSLIHI